MTHRTINALFDDYDHAAEAIRRLEASEIPHLDISLVAGNLGGAYSQHANRFFEDEDEDGDSAGTGATIGTLAGGGAGLLAGLGMLAIPGIGPVVAAGWLVSTLVGAGAGAAVGGLVGALADRGVSEEEAHRYEEGIRRGGVLVTVGVDQGDTDRVRTILDEAGRVEVEDREEAWRSEGWAPPIGAAASTTTGLTTDLMPNPLDDEETPTEVEVETERLRRIGGTDRDRR
ncbi:hypothetical protein [Microvirga subterranea]|uniref:Heat induced stress protein YflT n=1 Tax=Microvirga subterranea TaxID=186651 RepID=A0A370HJ16_9HYPH|nr:hypothetical protein [Microvirga subterranea]RDI58519.1 hypothetical protein DES45_10540 [Microvirga subterranea]